MTGKASGSTDVVYVGSAAASVPPLVDPVLQPARAATRTVAVATLIRVGAAWLRFIRTPCARYGKANLGKPNHTPLD